jgi:cyclopropane fatty-acyl-phospholipid synthase-like methyltransferase
VTQESDRNAADVAAYYDRNTRRFLRFGGARGSLAIHRQLWGEGVASAREAAEHVNELLADAIERQEKPAPAVIDLGCGVGGTLFSLAARLPLSRLVGVTISAEQRRIAERIGAAKGLADRCRFVQGDFARVSLDLAADAVVAIEAFAHCARPPAFFANAERHLALGGTLILIDDFLAEREDGLDPAARRTVEGFRRGWRVPGFGTIETALDAARQAGLDCVEERDLTPLIRLDQPSRRLIATLGPVCARLGLAGLPFFANLIGGGALQRGLEQRLFAYRWLRFERSAEPGAASLPAT